MLQIRRWLAIAVIFTTSFIYAKAQNVSQDITKFVPPKDCVWGEWDAWSSECPSCFDGDLYTEGEQMTVYRTRPIKDRGNRFGVCYSFKDLKQEHSLKVSQRRPETEEKVCVNATTKCFVSSRGFRDPVDCIWEVWEEWDPLVCPECIEPDYWDEEGPVRYRFRKFVKKGNRLGSCYSWNDTNHEHSLPYNKRRFEEILEPCPDKPPCMQYSTEWTEWDEWGDCEPSTCSMTRARNCTVVDSNGVQADSETIQKEGLEDRCKSLIEFIKNDTVIAHKEGRYPIVGRITSMDCQEWCTQLEKKEDVSVKASLGEGVRLMCEANGSYVPRTCLFESPSQQITAQFVHDNKTCVKVLPNVKPKDEGKWLCSFEMGPDVLQQTAILLTVEDKSAAGQLDLKDKPDSRAFRTFTTHPEEGLRTAASRQEQIKRGIAMVIEHVKQQAMGMVKAALLYDANDT